MFFGLPPLQISLTFSFSLAALYFRSAPSLFLSATLLLGLLVSLIATALHHLLPALFLDPAAFFVLAFLFGASLLLRSALLFPPLPRSFTLTFFLSALLLRLSFTISALLFGLTRLPLVVIGFLAALGLLLLLLLAPLGAPLTAVRAILRLGQANRADS